MQNGCTSAAIGCVECKQPVIDAVLAELKPIQERAKEYEDDLTLVEGVIDEGCEAAREVAKETLEDVREAMGLSYR